MLIFNRPNAQYAHCMCATQFSICSLYVYCSMLTMLIACVLLNAQYAQVCKMLNAYMLIGRVHARVFIVGMHGLPCVCVQKK